ncbi:MAG: NTPase [archaeon GB-1867-097]|nr:NTPase [Candidatus Culexmicrobium thermophilum]HDO19908.1 NTPase [Candidatus Bathyarchaeota archaeon]
MGRRLIILISGKPGVGKSTVCRRVVDMLKQKNFRVGGIICPEVRFKGVRIGFKIVDVLSGSEGWLSNVNFNFPIKVGKYSVNIRDLETIGISAINRASKCSDVIIIDELGPMEMKSKAFFQAFLKVLETEKPMIIIVHKRLKNYIVKLFRSMNVTFKIFEVTYRNRDLLPSLIFNELFRSLKRESKIEGKKNL